MRIGWFWFLRDRVWWEMMGSHFGVFRNLPHIVPGRWGFWIHFCGVGFEFGSRNPGHWFGLLLKRFGLYPW